MFVLKIDAGLKIGTSVLGRRVELSREEEKNMKREDLDLRCLQEKEEKEGK